MTNLQTPIADTEAIRSNIRRADGTIDEVDEFEVILLFRGAGQRVGHKIPLSTSDSFISQNRNQRFHTSFAPTVPVRRSYLGARFGSQRIADDCLFVDDADS